MLACVGQVRVLICTGKIHSAGVFMVMKWKIFFGYSILSLILN